jgi:hypothetical protein
MPDKHKFKIVTADGDTRVVVGDDATVHASGALLISGVKDSLPIMYAAGSWVLCESGHRLEATEDPDEPELKPEPK